MKNKGEEKKNLAELFKLMVEHPELEVIPEIDCEVMLPCEEFSWVMASFGKARIDEYYQESYGGIFLRSKSEELVIDNWMDKFFGVEEEDREEVRKLIPWTKAIFVEIEP